MARKTKTKHPPLTLDTMMINGKKLRDCTGNDLREIVKVLENWKVIETFLKWKLSNA
jgi:hypothetical protein